MAAVSHNHAKYQARLNYIQQLLEDLWNLSLEDIEQTEITPIQYDPELPFKYNNFVYRILPPAHISETLQYTKQRYELKQPGCVPIPAGTREFILRLNNPEAQGMHQETRVQNEVGILTLASAALRDIKPSVVPRVFGWRAGSGEKVGWILQELMPGVPLAEDFNESMSLDQKKGFLAQMAGLLKALQDYPLPKSIKGWGGVTFDDSGFLVSAPMSSVGAGPWSSFEDSYHGRLKVALAKADASPHLQGWRANGIRERIDAFIETGLSTQFSHMISKQDKTIVHADFTPDNLLYDSKTGQITALLDYDFSSVLHPAVEFFRSFASNGGQFLGWSDDKDAQALRDTKLTGQFPSPLPAPVPSGNDPGIDWELAQAWEVELQKLDVKRPSTIQGIDKVADVDELLGALLPWRLINDDFLRLNPDEGQRMALRRMEERHLISLLDHMGF